MRRFISIKLIVLLLISSMPGLAARRQVSGACTITGVIKSISGLPAKAVQLKITPLVVNGQTVHSIPYYTTPSDTNGNISFTILNNAIVNISGNALGFTGSGKTVQIDDDAEMSLDALVAVAYVPSGVTVYDETTVLTGLFGRFNFKGAGVTATRPSAGVVDVTIPGGGGTWGSITGTLSSQTDLQSALDAKQASDADLTAIAGLSPSNDDIIQRKAGAWTNRTIAQLKTDLSLSGTNTGDQTIGLTGDVTGSGTGSFPATIANDAVTFAKMQNISTNKLLGRSTASSGDVEEISVGSGLSLSGGTLSATGGGSSNPFDDATALVKGSADATKLFRIEVDTNVPTGTTVVGTVPASSFAFARTDAGQTFTGSHIFNSPPSSSNGDTTGDADQIFGASTTTCGAGIACKAAVFGTGATGKWQSVAFGNMARANFGADRNDATAIGYSTIVGGDGGTSLGSQAVSSGQGTALGAFTNAPAGSIALGHRTVAVNANHFVAGSNTAHGSQITDVFFGSGVIDTAPQSVTYHGTGGSGTNIIGADVAIAGGASTGTGAGGNVLVKTSPSGSSGTLANPLVTRYAAKAKGVALTSGAAANVVEVTLPTLAMTGGTISYTIIATDGTDIQALSGVVVYSAVNKGSSYTTSIKTGEGATADDTKAAKSVSAGTLTLAWSILDGANKVTVQATPTTSLTATKFLMYYTVTNNSEQALTPD